MDGHVRDRSDSSASSQIPADASDFSDGGRLVVLEGGVAPRTRENFRSVTMEFRLMIFTIEAPGTLILEDDKGVERLTLSPEDYERVLELVLDPAFMRSIWDTSDCQSIPDITVIVSATFSDIGLVSDTLAASCTSVECDAGPVHVYGRLICLLYDLWMRYMRCPTFDPATEKASRQLCNQCWYYVEDAPHAC